MAEDDKTAETLAEVKDEGVNLDEVSTETKPEAKDEPKAEGDAENDGSNAGDEEKPKKLSGAQKQKLREARLLSELSQRERENEELRRRLPAEKAGGGPAERKAPVEADFNGDFFAFQTAKTAFEAGEETRKALREDREEKETSERSAKQAEAARERQLAHLERVEDAREIIADFDQAMKAMDGVQVRQDVIDEIMSSENSAAISYHLAKNPDKLAAMDRMSARELAREMGRLEATVKLPEGKKHTTAPAPLAPLKGGASGSFDPAKASMDEYVAKRQAGWKG